jgi:hypothetical protein
LSDRILFTTSNGTGLGHLTRSMAIAKRLGPDLEPLFITLSAAAPVVEQMGFAVEYLASYATPASGNDYRWSRRLRARLRAAIAEIEPRVIVFDGTHPYEALLGALPAQTTAVWCRRPLWKRGSSRVPLGRAGAFDAVLAGDVATHDRLVRAKLAELSGRVDVVVLAQASMARVVVDTLGVDERRGPILSSPRLGMERVAARLGRIADASAPAGATDGA